MVVIEEPRIDFALAQRGLNRGQIHSAIVLDGVHPLSSRRALFAADPEGRRAGVPTSLAWAPLPARHRNEGW
jgi:hypothetical protein